jgi:ribonuclease III
MTDLAVERCEEIIGYEFQDKGILAQALTHSSAAATRLDSNERLEFLGDSVLGLSVCALLFNEHETLGEGEMTKIKSSVVSRKTCAQVVHKLDVHGLLSLSGEMTDPDRVPESVLAAVFESLIGAIYIDGGFEPANDFIIRTLAPFVEEALSTSHQQNYKSLLQQYAQRVVMQTPEYILLDEQGPDHCKCFEVAVSIGGKNFPSAWGRNKKEAEQAAAKLAVNLLGLLKNEKSPDDQDAQA